MAFGDRVPPMRYIMLIALMALVGACAELSEPTVVRYEAPSPFYVRHITWMDSKQEVDALATDVCTDAGGNAAELVSSMQPYSFDTRYATYRCLGLEPTAITAAPASGASGEPGLPPVKMPEK